MKKENVDPAISEAARALQKLGGKKAGINRWAGKTKEEKKAQSVLMLKARWGRKEKP